MKISARNSFEGTISALSSGPVSAEVEISTAGGDKLVATITQGSVQTLGLAVGKPVVALVKASNVMVMTDGSGVKLSARNCLTGTVKKLAQGPVSAEVIIALPGGAEIFASITRDATTELGIKEGVAATAVIKASSVIIGVKN
ncbi:TOBE domain-containing protein [Uliginosibacterium aquaticum]|uniref:TOBE domain-containing protein n=1 Tax=Uliginosibacterium aquaticum TaxID=2731212 RepID=A0ABX2IJ92_9RHOO|nr:TOBE domain-containing protein [Uliginosibacterium aquaticum]NSL54699.1 TOBE domain-containing protein [Uliginosibacterium aquaticum]